MAQSNDNWSHWSIVDGLVETWALGITTAPDGNVWVIHSEDGMVSVINGYGIKPVKCPLDITSIEFSPTGDMWALSPRLLHYRYGNEWVAYPLPFESDDSVVVKPLSGQIVIILFGNTLYAFNRSDSTFHTIKTVQETGLSQFTGLAASPENQLWVTGTEGIVNFQYANSSIQNWIEYSAESLDFYHFQSPWVSQENELYVIAQSRTKQIHFALVFKEEEWSTLHTANGLNMLQCWKGLDNENWILNRNNTLIKVQGSSLNRFTSLRSQFGQILDYTIQQDGIFWLATSKGVFRYVPSVWRTPDEIQDIQRSVNSIVQDREGRLWFDCTRFLLKLENGEWKRYPYPENKLSSFYETGTLCIMPNQSIAIRMLNAESVLTMFNPTTEQYETLENPYGLLFGAVTALNDGSIWFQMGQNFGNVNEMSYRIASYDGENFTTVFDNSSNWGISYPRSFLKEKDNGFWIGGTSGLGLYQNGQYILVNEFDEIKDEAAFALIRFQDRKIWAGGRNSIRVFDGTNWKLLLSNTDQIRSFYLSKDGTVWVCTAAGLIRYIDESWIKMVEKDGLPSNVVNEVFLDSQNNFWAATSNGIARYQPELDLLPPITSLDNSKNVDRFAPGTVVHISMNGTDMWKSTHELNLYYSYRINQEEWSPFTPNPLATFNEIVPGFYQFDFRVMDSNFNISPVSDPFPFEVLHHWYEEPFVIGLIITAFGMTLFFLIYAINHQIKLQFINTQLQTANQELERISCIDGLTNIANRRCFDDHLNTEWRRALRTQTNLSVIICDVDYFKLYNDHFGHLAGDDCLRLIAKTLNSTIQRAGDIVARYGGEEFVILLVNTSIESAQQVANLIHEKVEALSLMHPKSKCNPFVTISSGLASAVPQEKFTEKLLLAAADKALYLSKNNGRNRSSAIDNPFHETWMNGS